MRAGLDWQRGAREQFCHLCAYVPGDNRYLETEHGAVRFGHVTVGHDGHDGGLVLIPWSVNRAEDGREGDSLFIGEPNCDDIFLAHREQRGQSSVTVASKFAIIDPSENIRKGLSVTSPKLDDRYEARANLICQDATFLPLRDKLLHLLAAGNSPAKITKLLGIEEEVVRRVRNAHPESIKNIKQHIATQLAEATQVLTEELIERAHEIPAEHLGRAIQATVTGHQLLSGGYTARVEHRTIATPEDLQKMFDSLPSLEVTQIEDVKDGDSPKPV